MGSDVLILTIYFLVVIYVLYQMALSLEKQQQDQITISLNSETLLERVQAQIDRLPNPGSIEAKISTLMPQGFNGKRTPSEYRQLNLSFPESQPFGVNGKPLKGNDGASNREEDVLKQFGLARNSVSISVMPLGRRPLGPPIRFLSVQVVNRTPDAQIYIDWDRSSLTMMMPQAQRVIRVMPNMNLDLSLPQVFSVVNPGESVKMDATTERCFSRNRETQRLEVSQPVVDVAILSTLLTPEVAGLQEPSIQRSLYSISLMVGIRRISAPESQTTYLLLPFSFNLALLPSEIAFPPVRWLLSRPRHSAENFWSTLILGRPPKYRR